RPARSAGPEIPRPGALSVPPTGRAAYRPQDSPNAHPYAGLGELAVSQSMSTPSRTARLGLVTAALLLPGVDAAPAAAAPSSDAASTLIVIDAPRGGTTNTQLNVSGWAADPRASSGTGVDKVEVYLDGEAGSGGTFLGPATYGLSRP